LTDLKNKSELSKIVTPSVGSKQYGQEAFITDLVCTACLDVMPNNPRNFNVDNVRVVKILGGSLFDSRVIRGMVFGREAEGKSSI
jgi:T-complex protein 1 subunit theta